MCKVEVITAFFSKHFLPIGTLLIIPLGIVFPAPAVYLNGKLPVVQICIVTLFFVIGMKFRLAEIKSALRCYKEITMGLIVILLLTPIVGTKLLMLPNFRRVPRFDENVTSNNSWSIQLPDFGPEEFRVGLQIFCISPCASAFPTIVVTAANGDRALTLLVAVMATIISVFTAPVMAKWLIPEFQTASVGFQNLLRGVVLFILLPLIVGRILRFIPLVKKVVVKLNTPLKFVTSGALLVMFWVKISQATAKGDLQKFSPWMIMAVTALGTAVVTSFLVTTFIISSILRLPKESVLAITVLSSARTSSVAIAIIENLPDSVGDKDRMFFPIIFVYLAMVVIINSFGSFMTIKNEEKDIEQGIVGKLEDKPIRNQHINQVDELTITNREVVQLLEPVHLTSKSVGNTSIRNLIVNPLEQVTSQDIAKTNDLQT